MPGELIGIPCVAWSSACHSFFHLIGVVYEHGLQESGVFFEVEVVAVQRDAQSLISVTFDGEKSTKINGKINKNVGEFQITSKPN